LRFAAGHSGGGCPGDLSTSNGARNVNFVAAKSTVLARNFSTVRKRSLRLVVVGCGLWTAGFTSGRHLRRIPRHRDRNVLPCPISLATGDFSPVGVENRFHNRNLPEPMSGSHPADNACWIVAWRGQGITSTELRFRGRRFRASPRRRRGDRAATLTLWPRDRAAATAAVGIRDWVYEAWHPKIGASTVWNAPTPPQARIRRPPGRSPEYRPVVGNTIGTTDPARRLGDY